MKKFIIEMILFSILISSCLSQHIKSTSVEQNPAPIHICFKLIVENKYEEFKTHSEECKTYQNQNGTTSLMMAIAKDNNDIAEYLIEQKIDVNQADLAGFTALTFAANKNNARLVQVLRRNKARIEVLRQNLSSLMMAARNSSLQLIEVMNPDENEINLRAEDGWTALYFAIARQDKDIVKYFISKKACLLQRDNYNQTPLDFAKELKWQEGIRILTKVKRKSC